MFRYNQIADMTFSAGEDTHTNGSPMAPFVKKSISVPTCIKFLNKNNIVVDRQLKERTPVATVSAGDWGWQVITIKEFNFNSVHRRLSFKPKQQMSKRSVGNYGWILKQKQRVV